VSIATRKARARKAALARRKAAHEAAHEAGRARPAVDNLLALLATGPAGAIAGYMPIRTEIDPLPAMRELARRRTVAVPVVLGPGRPLAFHRWAPDMPMQVGAFGAMIPREAIAVTPRIVILPLVAFDRRGFRLGYGGGFYDRTLEGLRARGPVLAVGLAYGAQQVERLPVEPTDQPMDAVVTERGVLEFPRD